MILFTANAEGASGVSARLVGRDPFTGAPRYRWTRPDGSWSELSKPIQEPDCPATQNNQPDSAE